MHCRNVFRTSAIEAVLRARGSRCIEVKMNNRRRVAAIVCIGVAVALTQIDISSIRGRIGIGPAQVTRAGGAPVPGRRHPQSVECSFVNPKLELVALWASGEKGATPLAPPAPIVLFWD